MAALTAACRGARPPSPARPLGRRSCPARARCSPPSSSSLENIEHVVVLMQENRSFDLYFGTMAGVRGFRDKTAITLSTGRSVFYQPDSKNPDGYLLPFHLDAKATNAPAIPSSPNLNPPSNPTSGR